MSNWARVIGSLGALLAAFAFLRSYDPGLPVPLRRPLAELPAKLGQWTGRENAPLGEKVADILRLSDYLMRRYSGPGGDSLWLYVGYWDTQRRGAQIHSPKHCLPGGGWNPLQADLAEIPLSTGSVTVNRYLMQKESRYMMVAYWFETQGQAVASELDAKLMLVKSSITRHRSDAALVRITTEFSGDPQKAWARLADYIRVVHPKLEEILPE